MQNPYTQVTTTGLGSGILGSIVGVFVGAILFIVSFGILWWNEGRVDLSKIAKTAVQVDSTKPDTANNQKLVAVGGSIVTDDSIKDDPYIKPDKYIILRRKTEMYAWVEKKDTSKSTNTGGSQTTTTTYSYSREWENKPSDSRDFKDQATHTNPPKSLDDKEYRTNTAQIGVYGVIPQSVDALNLSSLNLTPENTKLAADVTLPSESYLYMGKGTLTDPQIGDIRISYTALPSATQVTLFGKLNGTMVETYTDSSNNRLFRIFAGSFSDAVSTLHTEYTTMVWILWFVGFLLMWIGLSLIFEPISVFLDIIPIFGTLSRTVIGFITFVVSLVLSILTILVGIVFHNIFALILTLVLAAGAAYFYISTKKNKLPPQQPPVTRPLAPPSHINPQLLNYINQMRAQGMTNEQLLPALISAGWSTSVAMHALGMRGQAP